MCPIDVQAADAVWRARPEIVAAWLFGSAQNAGWRQGSDVDLGILVQGRPSLNFLADLRLALQEALAFDDIDLVPLNEASPVLRFEAVSGRRLFCRDEDATTEFVSLTAREYEDEMAMLHRALRQGGGQKAETQG